jgi:uncharacterized protein YciI
VSAPLYAPDESETRQRVLITSTPPRRAAVHPSLQPLGRRAPRYVQRVRRRHRRMLTRRGATGLLVLGVLVSGPMLAVTGGPDASASRGATPTTVMAVNRHRTHLEGPRETATEQFVAPIAPPVHVTSTTLTTLGSRFVGAYAIRNERKIWVSYPTGRFHPFLVCTRSFESDTAGGYDAVSPDGRHRGAYQFKRSTWNTVARNVGRDDLINVDPATAAAVDQDWMALYLYKWLGASHWEGRCAGK